MTLTARPRLLIRFAALAALALCGIVLALSSTGTPPVGAQDGPVPAKPTGVVATATHDSVALAWDDPSDASITHYQIFRRDRDVHDTGEFVEIDSNTGSAATSYTDANVEPEGSYVYRVKAVNQHGASTWSNFVRADTPAAPDPADLAPSGLEVSLVENRVTLTWDAPASDAASVTGYEILRRRPNDGEAALTTLVADTGNAETGYTDDSANEPGVSYTYRVRALRDGEQSKVSNYARIDLPDDYAQDTPEPEEEPSPEALAPSGLTAEAAKDGGVALSWTAPAEDAGSVTGYEVLRGQGSAALATLAADTGNTDTTYTDSGVTGDLDGYRYQVKALRGGDASQGSNVAGVLQSAHAGAIVPLDDVTLISNLGKFRNDGGNFTNDQAQAFTTGSNSGGYSLTKVVIASNLSASANFTVSVHGNDSGAPGTSLGTLTNPTLPATGEAGNYEFTHSGIDLAASTTYFIVVDVSTSSSFNVIHNTDSDAEDTGGATGWSIGDSSLYRGFGSTGSWTTWAQSKKISITGTVKGGTTNSDATGAPTITGTPAVGELLTADISNIGDADGIADADFEYQWIVFDGTADSDISGATGETYRPLLAHLDQTIKVRVSFDDDDDNAESLTSAATTAVTASTYGQVIWAATLTVEEETVSDKTFFGYNLFAGRGSLEPVEFTYDGVAHLVTALQYIEGDTLRISTNHSLGSEDFNLYLDGAPFLMESPGLIVEFSDHGLTWTDGQEVEVRLTVNRTATGAPAITGKPEVGETLTAGISGIMDEDGLPAAAQFAYQWISNDGTDDSDIDGATDSTYTLVEADAGKSIKVRVSFTDNAKFPESLTSAPTAAVTVPVAALVSNVGQTAAGNANVTATQSQGQGFTTGSESGGYTLGSVELAVSSFSGTASGITVSIYSESSGDPGTVVHTLTTPASISTPVTTFTAPSGTTLAAGTTYYVVISTTGSEITLGRTNATAEDTGGASGWSIADDRRFFGGGNWVTTTSPIRMRVNGAAASTDIWSATLTVAEFTIEPNTYRGYTHVGTAVGELDPSTFSHDGDEITVNNLWHIVGGLLTFEISQELGGEGFLLRLGETLLPLGEPTGDPPVYRFSDHGVSWSVGDTVEVRLIPNQAATGAPVITGTPEVSQTLTADISGIMDEDGLPADDQFAYQWIADDSDIDGATDSTYMLVEADAGKTIKVRVSFTDNGNYPESLTSAAVTVPVAAGETALVSNMNQTTSGSANSILHDGAQAFTTGTNSFGYTLESVEISLTVGGSPFPAHTLSIWTESSNNPGSSLGTLTNPDPVVNGVNTYTTTDGISLSANTTYFIVVDNSPNAGDSGRIAVTGSDSEDSGAASGWSIGDGRVYRDHDSTGSWGIFNNSLKIRINGQVAPPEIPADSSLVPDGLGLGDQFRLIFLSSETRTAEATDIATYNAWVQGLAANGHTDIQDYTETFRAVGCTAAVDARDYTGTTYTSDDKGVAIYWLGGDKAADDYEDFYDETWDEEASMRDESGNTVSAPGSVWTGCEHDGTEGFRGGGSSALGSNRGVVFGVPNSDATNEGPLSGNTSSFGGAVLPFYGLSGVFQVGAIEVPADWSLVPSGLQEGDQFRLLFISSAHRNASPSEIATYNTWVQDLAANGHTDIQDYSSSFRAVGSTEDMDARDNTGTTYTSSDKGVAIYWLGGNKVADDYEDFYDEDWDEEASMKNESGTAETGVSAWTGSDHDGTEMLQGTTETSRALGNSNNAWVRFGKTDSASHGPLSGETANRTGNKRIYGLSGVFEVVAGNNPATGAPTITGTAQVGGVLTADASNIGDPDGISGATFSYQWIADDGTTDSDIDGATGETYWPSAGDVGNTIKVRVSFTDDLNNEESVTSAATGAVAGPAVTAVPADWSLIPDGLGAGDQFRLLFLSSSSRNATPTSIATYNTWIQDRVDAGHTDIQDYTETFRAVGCTAAVDARDDTGTTYTSDDKGVPIYWLNGDKAADEYEDFYDETWDEEASMRDESGNTVSAPGSVWTGCEHDGTEAFANLMSLALGNNMGVIFGVPNSDATNAGPLSSGASGGRTVSREFYGLSGVFSVSPPGEILYSATLTVGEETFGLDTNLGYHSDRRQGSLHPVLFAYAGSHVGVYELYYSVGGDLVLDVNAPGASLLGSGSFNLYLDGAAFLIEDPASDSDGVFEFSDHGLSWTNGQIVRVWLTENQEPKLTISGTTLVGQTLTATIDEPDGLPPSDQITYQWIRVDGNTESDISGETGSTYTLVDADEGKTIKVEASYTDNANFAESLTSAATTAVVAGKAALVSNLGQAAHSAGVSATDSQDLAQGFTTGSRSGGYTLGSVELDVTGFTGTASDVTVSIYSESGNDPNTAVHVLTTPASISGLTTFTAPSNANLAADTQYYVVITTAGEDVTLSRTDSTADDSGGAAGWSIQDSGRINETGWTITTRPLRISIKGLATASDDATLSDLVLNDGTNDLTLTPTFASGMTSYTAEVAYTIDQLTLTPTKSDSNADVEYLDDDDKTIADADTVTTGQQVDLKEGANTIKVKVTAEDHVATETYEVTVTRETARAHCDDTEVWCETMVVGSVGAVMGWDEPGLVVGGALSAGDEDFDYGMHTYDFTSIFLSGSTLSIQFNAGSTGDLESRRTRDKLVFTVDGQEFNLGAGELHSNGRGVTWNSTNLTWATGESVALEVVEAEVSTVATLEDLVVNDGTNDLTLMPTFVFGTKDYTVAVHNAISRVTVTPELSHSWATVEYLDGSGNAIADADGMTEGQQVDLDTGANTIAVKVTAEDGMAEETYTVVVTRADPPAHCDGTEIWCETMTPGSHSEWLGWEDDGAYSGAALATDDENFDYGGQTYNLAEIALASTGPVAGTLLVIFDSGGAGDLATKATRDKLTLNVGGQALNFRDATYAAVTRTLQWESTALTWTAGTDVALEIVEAPPSAPTNVQASGNAELTVTWDAPNDGGSAITGYTVQWKSGTEEYDENTRQATVTTTTHTIPSLANDTTYTLRVKATNAFGDSGWTEITATPLSGPGVASVTVDQASITQTLADVTVTVANLQNASHTVYLRYRVEGGSWPAAANQSMSTSGTAVTFTLSGLTGNTEYDVQASLDDTFMSGVKTATFTTSPTKPGKTRFVEVTTSGNGTLFITWQEPDSDGGSAITGYTVQWKSGRQSFGDPSREHTTMDSFEDYLITGLTNGTEYTVRVIAVNAVGGGPPSDTTTGTPVGPPDAPPNVQAGSGHQQLTVSWGAPNDGGSAITEYTLQWKSGTQSYNTTSRQATVTTTTHTIPSLANGTEYTVRVRATTALGDSGWSAEAKGTPREGPHVSTVRVKEPISCTVTFVELEFVNLDSTTEYQAHLRFRAQGSSSWTVLSPQGFWSSGLPSGAGRGELNGPSPAFTLTDLAYETAYEVQAALDSGFVDGLATTTFSTPNLSEVGLMPLSPGDGTLGLRMTRPTSEGRVDGYVLQWKSGDEEYDDTDTSERQADVPGSGDREYTITGLDNGVEYTVRAMAYNDNGVGVPSSEVRGTPEAPPNSPARGAPTISGTAQVGETLTADTGGIEDDDGLADAVYSYQWLAGDADISGATGETYTPAYDDQGKVIRVRVSFIDDRDFEETLTSEPTEEVAEDPDAPTEPPNAPRTVRIVGDTNTSLTLTWDAPDGGTAVTEYRVQWLTQGEGFANARRDGREAVVDASARSHTITGLTMYGFYQVRVLAVNGAGESKGSNTAWGFPGLGEGQYGP